MFGKQLHLFKLKGFEVKVDWSWIIIAVLIAWSLSTGLFPFHYEGFSTITYWIMGIVAATGLFISIIVHEFAHSMVARSHDMPIKGITLFIFGGLAEMNEEPPSAKAELYMAIAGPITSILLAVFFYGISYLASDHFGWPKPVVGVLEYLALINLILAIFNLIPAFPLDGGRVLRAILWKWKGNVGKATRIASKIGRGFGIFLIVMGVLNILYGNVVGGFWWILIGFFIYNAAKMSYRQLVIRNELKGEAINKFVNDKPITVPPDITITELVENYIYKYHFKMFPVVKDGHLAGCVTTNDVKKISKDDWNKKKIKDILHSCNTETVVPPNEDAMHVLAKMSKSKRSRLLVVDGDQLVGVITLKDLLRFLSVKLDLDNEDIIRSK